MINWFNMPAEGLSNGGEFEIKELTATENKVYQKDGEVYNKVTVNVEGGGGSSDLTTATITLNSDYELYGCFVSNDGYSYSSAGGGAGSFDIILYKGKALLYVDGTVQSTSGDIEYDSDFDGYFVTGDCTIS